MDKFFLWMHRSTYRVLVFLLLLISSSKAFSQKFEGLAKLPPMGWNTWNKFSCDINEKLIRESADAIVSSGMKDAGYIYVIIDDCWHGKRDSLGFIHEDPERFPSGMKALADYIHSRGLKFGIYSDAGWTTCGGRPGSRGHEYQDAMTYASWGVDYLKYDWCATEGLNAEGAYLTMRNALYAAGRPILFGMCEWGNNKPWEWGPKVGHMWRTTGDIYHCFDCEKDYGSYSSWGVLQILDMQDGLRKYAGPDHWNDPDMMEVGNGMTPGQDRAHFSMWCMLAAPLIAGNDIANMKPETKALLIDKEAIAIDQDPLGIQGLKYSSKEGLEVWFKPLQNDEWAVCFLNRNQTPVKINFDWIKEPVKDDVAKRDTNFEMITYKIRDIWAKKEVGNTKKAFTAELPAQDVILLRLTKESNPKAKR